MAIKWKHDNGYAFYFCTFTCHQWLPLFEITQAYDTVYKWFQYLSTKQVYVAAYVIMPNHVHCLLYFPAPGFDLNKIIANAKRFMAYEIIRRLNAQSAHELFKKLATDVSAHERRKGQLHKVFAESFDAKPVYSEAFFQQKVDYIHHNPVSGKWQLATDFTAYPHSSASFYEHNRVLHFSPVDYRCL